MSLVKALYRILAFVGKELVEVRRRPGALLSLILGPFLIMAIFGVGYGGYRRPLNTVVVVPAESGLPTDIAAYKPISGSGLEIIEVTSDEASADARLRDRTIDVVLVAPSDVEANFRAGQQSVIKVLVNVVDPVDANYAVFLARALEREVNRVIIERIAEEGQSYALGAGASEAAEIPPAIVAAPTRAEVVNVAPSQPGVVQFFGTAVLALILQHMAVTLIALSVVRERMSGLFEIFRVSPTSTAELLIGKLIAFGILCGGVALVTLLLLIFAFNVPMLGEPALLAALVVLLILASMGLGLLRRRLGLGASDRAALTARPARVGLLLGLRPGDRRVQRAGAVTDLDPARDPRDPADRRRHAARRDRYLLAGRRAGGTGHRLHRCCLGDPPAGDAERLTRSA